jgi:hypothetical protein
MIHGCAYCNKPFTVFRKDKRYCSNSCKQMAFLKRQNVKPSIDVSEKPPVKKEPNKYESLIYEKEEQDYITITCKWIKELHKRFDERGNDTWLKLLSQEKEQRVEWIGIHYRCLLDCVLMLSNLKVAEWADLAEVTNAFTFLISTAYFKELPIDYPYTKDINLVRDKLKTFCLETQEEEYMQFQLKPDTKKELLLQRYELASVYSKISFNQLQLDFKDEFDKQVAVLKQEQNKTEPEKEKLWHIRYRALKRKEPKKIN